MHCREILVTPHCSLRAREVPTLGEFFCLMHGFGVMSCRGIQIKAKLWFLEGGQTVTQLSEMTQTYLKN